MDSKMARAVDGLIESRIDTAGAPQGGTTIPKPAPACCHPPGCGRTEFVRRRRDRDEQLTFSNRNIAAGEIASQATGLRTDGAVRKAGGGRSVGGDCGW